MSPDAKTKLLSQSKIDSILELSLSAAKNLSAMWDQWDDLLASEREANQRPSDSFDAPGSTIVPDFSGIEAFTNSYIQRCDHCFRSLIDIVKLLYDEWSTKGYFEGFRDHLEMRHKDIEFADYLSLQLNFIKFIRETRNSVEHPKLDKRLIIKNYHIVPSGHISAPTIEAVHPDYYQKEIGISKFIHQINTGIADVYEEMLALLFDRRGGNFGVIKFRVFSVPEDRRRYGKVKYKLSIETFSKMTSSATE